MRLFSRKTDLPTADTAFAGRDQPVSIDGTHTVLGTGMLPPWPAGTEVAVFGMGCFWGIERLFWRLPGVYTTAAGYAGGYTANPSYEQVCSGRTGHTEAVLVIYDPAKISYDQLLRAFWENHDPTQGMRQYNDVGSQYRSAIYPTTKDQAGRAATSRDSYAASLTAAGYGDITTEIKPLDTLYYAEDYHQQYLDKNPGGYCNMHGTGISCSIGGTTGLGVSAH
ncbi:peptide-methionine (S)-S-oxide reductase MsrA [Nakamurella sp. GG22]